MTYRMVVIVVGRNTETGLGERENDGVWRSYFREAEGDLAEG